MSTIMPPMPDPLEDCRCPNCLPLLRLLPPVVYASSSRKGITWTEFVTGIPQDTMPELIQYLKERCLYVNEPVPAAEEV